MSTPQTHTGVFQSFRWRNNDEENPYVICSLEDGTVVQGNMNSGDFMPGVTYDFYASGRNAGWVENHHGRSFKFSMYAIKIAHTKHGVVTYLQRYGKWIGPALASRIYDHYGPESIKAIRTKPHEIITLPHVGSYLTYEKALECAALLEEHAALEDTKIGLTNLFAGRGFPAALIEACVKKWGILAPERIKHDPFTLLVNRMPGCGFSRCDKFYLDLGRPPKRLKRQMICAWHSLNSDTSGNTWVEESTVRERVKQLIGGAEAKPGRAIKMGIRSRWICHKRDAGGKLWLAEGDRARDEAFVAEQLKALSEWEAGPSSELLSLIAANQQQHDEQNGQQETELCQATG